jgi:hypothetical protein
MKARERSESQLDLVDEGLNRGVIVGNLESEMSAGVPSIYAMPTLVVQSWR